MKSATPGTNTSAVELANVSPIGFWILIDGVEHYLPFEYFPWFKKASIEELANIEPPMPHHLYWPDLDIDLSLESIRSPQKFPLTAKG